MKFRYAWEDPDSGKSHLLEVEGTFQYSDGDEIRPGYKWFVPERIYLMGPLIFGVRRRRLLPHVYEDNYDLWEELSYAGDDVGREELNGYCRD